jgi:alpha-L-fucosidase 2
MRITIAGIFLMLLFFCGQATAQENILWYKQPARAWTEALPVGNGRMGAMVFGHPSRERIQLNEETVWAGTRINDLNPGSRANLSTIQQKLLEGSNQEAYDLTKKHMLGTPPRIRSYQTLGDLYIQFADTIVRNYRRQLDLSTAVHTTTYELQRSTIKETVFMSAPDNIMVVRLHSSNSGGINARISLEREKDAATSASGNQLIMQGQINDPEKDTAFRGPAGRHLRF